jgi:hypothetical protein
MTNSLEPSASFGSDPSPKATWRWQFEDAAGAEVSGGSTSGATGFPSQSDAESWIGEAWRDLLEDGVEQVTLFEGDREVYGPMSLHAST